MQSDRKQESAVMVTWKFMEVFGHQFINYFPNNVDGSSVNVAEIQNCSVQLICFYLYSN